MRASEKNNKWYLVLNTTKEALKTASGFTLRQNLDDLDACRKIDDDERGAPQKIDCDTRRARQSASPTAVMAGAGGLRKATYTEAGGLWETVHAAPMRGGEYLNPMHAGQMEP